MGLPLTLSDAVGETLGLDMKAASVSQVSADFDNVVNISFVRGTGLISLSLVRSHDLRFDPFLFLGLSRRDTTQVPKNARGGVLVCEEELKAAFEFFDVEGKGVITASTLRKRLGAFHRSLSARVSFATWKVYGKCRDVPSGSCFLRRFLFIFYLNRPLLSIITIAPHRTYQGP